MRRFCFVWMILNCLGGAAFRPMANAIFWGQQARSRNSYLSSFRAGGSALDIMNDDSTFRPQFLEDEDDDNDGDSNQQRPILIVMDGFCPYHGGYLIQRALEAGARVIPVLGEYLRKYLLHNAKSEEEASDWQALRIPTTPEEAREWQCYLSSKRVTAVYCESDSGLDDAEQLRLLLNVKCQDNPVVSPARRDKFLMNECIQQHGLAVAQQKLCSSATEAHDFAQTLLSLTATAAQPKQRVVLKPFRGVASESVFLCETLDQVQEAWDAITKTTVFGSTTGSRHDKVLVQEFLRGTEYAVDVVSRNGQHKIAAVWKYDKRAANGAPFCYFQTKLSDAALDPDHVPRVQEYVRNALDALGVRYGFSHNEVIVTDDRGPVLVEVNCRQHNMDFAPLTMACIGYNALDMAMDALLLEEDDDSVWDFYPDEPTLRAYGCMVHLVNYCHGVLRQVNYMDEMSDLPSFFRGEVYERFQQVGEPIQPTIDIRSDAGWIQLITEDPEELEQDYKQIVTWMPSMFEVE